MDRLFSPSHELRRQPSEQSSSLNSEDCHQLNAIQFTDSEESILFVDDRPLHQVYSDVMNKLQHAINESTGWSWRRTMVRNTHAEASSPQMSSPSSDTLSKNPGYQVLRMVTFLHDIIQKLRHWESDLIAPESSAEDQGMAIPQNKDVHSITMEFLLNHTQSNEQSLARTVVASMIDVEEGIQSLQDLYEQDIIDTKKTERIMLILDSSLDCMLLQTGPLRASVDLMRREEQKTQHHMVPDLLESSLGSLKIDSHMEFPSSTAMPWSKLEPSRSGTFDGVYKAAIGPDGHTFYDYFVQTIQTTKNKFLTVKKIWQADNKASASRLRYCWVDQQHTHIIPLLLTFTLANELHFVFPWSGCDLELYWSREEIWWSLHSEFFDVRFGITHWISRQILGLSEAVDKIHDPKGFNGVHGDLRPQNIFWFPTPRDIRGILVITDFDLSARRYVGGQEEPGNAHLGITNKPPAYQSPEAILGTFAPLAKLHDIWSLGCILLEMVCWVIGGPSLLDRFRTERVSCSLPEGNGHRDSFFEEKLQPVKGNLTLETHTPRTRLKSRVTQFIAKLHGQCNCTRYLHDLLDLIEYDMLVILSPSTVRMDSEELLKRIVRCHIKVMACSGLNDPYCMVEDPGSLVTRNHPSVLGLVNMALCVSDQGRNIMEFGQQLGDLKSRLPAETLRSWRL